MSVTGRLVGGASEHPHRMLIAVEFEITDPLFASVQSMRNFIIDVVRDALSDDESCVLCGGPAEMVTVRAPVQWGDWPEVEVDHNLIQCVDRDGCGEEFYAPGEADRATFKALQLLLRDHAHRECGRVNPYRDDMTCAKRLGHAGSCYFLTAEAER